MKTFLEKLRASGGLVLVGVGAVALIAATVGYAAYFSDRIVPRTYVGTIPVGGLSVAAATERVHQAVDRLQNDGLHLNIDGADQVIHLDDIGFDLDVDQTVQAAFVQGHDGSAFADLWHAVASVWHRTHLQAPVQIDEMGLAFALDDAIADHEVPRKDVRLEVSRKVVRVLTDTAPGRVVDRDQATAAVLHALAELDSFSITLTLRDDPPVGDPFSADRAASDARKIVSRPLFLKYEDFLFSVSSEKIGSWIVSRYDGASLTPGLNRQLINQYVTRVAAALNLDSYPPHITTEGDKVIGFTPATVGRSVAETQLAELIVAALQARIGPDNVGDTITIPMKPTQMTLTGLDASSGITELIGKAVTTLTGSPKNRISNIKNGVKFISGTIIQPGQDFSTLKTLGAIDNTTGYLPELVIKGDRTTPEFGGGLCQVSTTLFRAVMNAALPITARRNHSYRVSYYEKDGDGKPIGPGLDATIYQPDLDFKFHNDTATPVLILGYVIGDRVTFELYGTKDGRSSHIDGPTLLSSVPSGEPVYLPTDTLPLGMKKQVETAHPGGSATATYSITYVDGHTASQVFKSHYRPWPAKFLVGTNANCTTAGQCAAISSVFAPSPTPTP